MHLQNHTRNAAREGTTTELHRVPVSHKSELAALHIPSARDFLELGRDISLAPLRERFPASASKLEGHNPYAWAYIRHKCLGVLSVGSAACAISNSIKAVRTFGNLGLEPTLLPAMTAVVLGWMAYKMFTLARMSREIREHSIRSARMNENAASDAFK